MTAPNWAAKKANAQQMESRKKKIAPSTREPPAKFGKVGHLPSRLPLGDRYVATLNAQIHGTAGEGKSARTRAKLKLAAVKCLSEKDLANLTIASVTGKAKVASGTFYLHFDSIRDLALEVFSEYAAVDVAPAIPEGDDFVDLFSHMKATFLEIVGAFRRRRKFLRSLFQMKRQDSEANEAWLQLTSQWADVLSTIAKAHASHPVPAAFDRFIGHATSAFADEIMTRIFVDEIFGADFPENPDNDEHVAELLAFTRHRMLFGVDPDPRLLKATSRLGRFPPPAEPSPADPRLTASRGQR